MLKNKKMLIIVFLIISIISIVIVLGWQHRYAFTSEKWINQPETRIHIYQNLLNQKEIIGMEPFEVLSLLGKYDSLSHEGDTIFSLHDGPYVLAKDRYIYTYFLGNTLGRELYMQIIFENDLVIKIDFSAD